MMKLIRTLMMLAALLPTMATEVQAQRIVAIQIDTLRCLGDTLTVSVGHSPQHDVVVEWAPSSISHPQRTFLPDGAVCDSSLGTCTYRSPIRFAAFDPNSTVTQASDIQFVRLNIEHSYIGDVFIALECPTGKFSTLLPASTPPTSSYSCGDPIFDSIYGWDNTYPTIPTSTFLGDALNSNSISNYCDSNEAGNAPGVGWNYCWSESSLYQYAPNDGLIYRSTNLIPTTNDPTSPNYWNRYSVDSTHIASGSNYYHPEQSFDSLVGCPLNGTWNIVLQDNWSADNGYIFDWELSLNPAMLMPVRIDSIVIGNGTIAFHDDSTITILPPAVDTDTTITYPLRIIISSGDTLDTAFSIHWLEPFAYATSDTLCQGDTARWTSLRFTSDTVVSIRTTRANGCDSIVDLSYTFMPSYSLHDTLPFCANEPFVYEGIDYGGPTTLVVPHQTIYGCDSSVTVHLIMIDSAFQLQLQMSLDGVQWFTDTTLHGCQPQTLYLRDTTLFEQWRRWDFGDGDTLRQEITSFQQPEPITHTYDSIGNYMLSLSAASIHGCVDSTVQRREALHVLPSPEADFVWEGGFIVSHDPQTRFINRSHPLDQLTYLWHIPSGGGDDDTSTAVSPHYEWPVGTYGDLEARLVAFWTHSVGNATVVCTDTSTQTVTIINEFLQFPNLVTPNGDGVNDRWVVVNLLESGIYSMNELWIYDRTGALVYHVRNIRHEEDFWNPAHMPDGTYFYRFSAKNPWGTVRHNGVIEVVR